MNFFQTIVFSFTGINDNIATVFLASGLCVSSNQSVGEFGANRGVWRAGMCSVATLECQGGYEELFGEPECRLFVTKL